MSCLILPLHPHPCTVAAAAPPHWTVRIHHYTSTFCWASLGTAQAIQKWAEVPNTIFGERWNRSFTRFSHLSHSNFRVKENKEFISCTQSSLLSFDTQAWYRFKMLNKWRVTCDLTSVLSDHRRASLHQFFICKQFSLGFAAVWGGPRTSPLSEENILVQTTKLRLKNAKAGCFKLVLVILSIVF